VLEIQLAHEEVLVRGAAVVIVVAVVLVAKVVLRVGFGGHAVEGVGVRAAGVYRGRIGREAAVLEVLLARHGRHRVGQHRVG
jgi:hypothetical protein